MENLGAGCCGLEASAGCFDGYLGVLVLDPVDSGVYCFVLGGRLDVRGAEADVQGAGVRVAGVREAGYVPSSQEHHFLQLFQDIWG